MDAETFVTELDARNQGLLRRLAPEATLKPEVEGDLNVVSPLKVALAKHYRLIADRLRELGFDTRGFDTLPTTVERVAAGQFTREAIAIAKNRQFIEFCEAAGDPDTARLYRETIEPDERHHHELGRRLLLRYATTPEAQAAARGAAERTLELAEAPGC